jgi:hypothetical protein
VQWVGYIVLVPEVDVEVVDPEVNMDYASEWWALEMQSCTDVNLNVDMYDPDVDVEAHAIMWLGD